MSCTAGSIYDIGLAGNSPGQATSGTRCLPRCLPACLQVIAPDQVRKGFLAAIEALEDLHLDVPGVVDLLALFICRWAGGWVGGC
jgi:hypothetical protein